ncbi:glycosyltransferase involved in cell wall biosynthesis [Limosilactobacillus mucosae]|uniref:Undecaprenyl phosphate 4-deoxy-4-formamido-L-arabinose transferase n=2 Tax=Limosilactobacillus mucosae TaxID=97478 RepID=A0A0R1NZ59_LIMMU|nr:glycosyltransferase family 2 protein [Limosilactobacillus mucosae]MDO5013909.1 glycosyltransferase family 2 protein [Lactobacillaceae bacterium]KRL25199.1 undecaprenyl phosphate 4-deoxy-4-formamido-L-arabinose transferase [Limosilactobacillus mucosae DSM 13345]MDC2843219.1 glycosyltransferase family 2 protein [Limosilactobacillus mucosae]PWJ46803.1 glycosyltransferase involved in cell wall biosynthesis [Limosilactobacillus mucosae]QOL69885.1 glycosyltransferase family 2 protein [Limosilacto
MSKLSIVVPCYNEEESIPLFYPAVEKVVRQMNDLQIEYWFVNDGSSDNSLVEMRKLHEQNPERVHYISFSRNFGKEAGLYAGLQAATGDYIVVMDVDLQDPPEFLPKMYELLQTGEYDCIGTRRVDRAGEAKFKSFLSTQFYHIINRLSQTNIVPGARDYRMMTRQMVDAVLSLKEYNRFSKGIFSWVGFKTKYLDYHNVERVAGKTDWSTWKLFKYAFDGIADFSQVPLSIAVWLGTTSFVLSIIGLLFVIIRRIVEPGSSVFGWASMICIILLLGGLQLLCIGILGKYIGRIYLQVKQRPIYIIKEKK